MERKSEITVSDEVIDDLKRMKRIISTHVPSFTKVQVEIPGVIQQVIQNSAANQRILKKTASTHIKNSVQANQYFGHALNSNHDMEIDMRRQRLSWLNREFPRHMKQNSNKKILDSQSILQTLEKLRNMSRSGQQSQITNRQIRSSSFNPTSIVISKSTFYQFIHSSKVGIQFLILFNKQPIESDKNDNNVSSERVSREIKRKIDPPRFSKIEGYIKEEDIQDDSQGFVFLQRQYNQISKNYSFDDESNQNLGNQNSKDLSTNQRIIDQANQESGDLQNKNIAKFSNNNNIYNLNMGTKILKLTNKQKKHSLNQLPITYQISQKECDIDKNLPQIQKISKNKSLEKGSDKNKQQYYSPIKPVTMNFGTALQLDKDMIKLNEQLLLQKQQNEQSNSQRQITISNSSQQNNQNQLSQQSQRPRIFSEEKRFDQNDGSQMFPLNYSNVSPTENDQFLLAKSLSNVQFSHLKPTRYIDYVNHVQNNYELLYNPLKDSKLHSTTMTTFNTQQFDAEPKLNNLPLDDICKSNINNESRMIKKEIDLQKILNAKGMLNKNNQFLSQSGYIQQEDYLSSAQWQPSEILEVENKLNCREKAHMNIYQHQFVKKYLTMKKETFKKHTNTQSLSSIIVDQNSKNNLNFTKKQNQSKLNQQNQNSIQNNLIQKKPRQDNSDQQKQLLISNNHGRIQYEQIRSSDKFFSNSTVNDIPKQTLQENRNHYFKELKSFKILKQIISRNPQQYLQAPPQKEQLNQQQQQSQQQIQQFVNTNQKPHELRTYLDQQQQ